MSGVATSSSHTSIIHQHPTPAALSKAVTNARHKTLVKTLGSMTAMEALFEQITQHHFYFEHTDDEQSNQLKYLFWALEHDQPL
jgi:hypothetical protein